ncbi:MAG: deoxyribodipyrimidine photo-lyase [Vampirovibrionales bacterium]|nr:deoxyribodipyrimidine photo-lyase [Vampirovibrionales bacterium]
MMTDAAPIALIWLRQCLRLQDNPMLVAALAQGLQPVFVYCWHPEGEGDWPLGGASKWWLHYSLQALERDITARGSQLMLIREAPEQALPTLAKYLNVKHVWADCRVEPAARAQTQRVDQALKQAGIAPEWLISNWVLDHDALKNGQGEPYQVYSALWRAWAPALADTQFKLLTAPELFTLPQSTQDALATLTAPKPQALGALKLLSPLGWDAAFNQHWQPGEAGARKALTHFLSTRVQTYNHDRDRPYKPGTSRLSPHLRFGELSPRQIIQATIARMESVDGTSQTINWAKGTAGVSAGSPKSVQNAVKYIQEVLWREFAYYLLWHFPHTANAPLKPAFNAFPWVDDPAGLARWQAGLTGFPIVDAGMRELWHTGWMHNRVRMIAGSFLVKDLRINWLEGARWFWDTLVDADLASNTLGWQWVAGCGADAAPYFRIFNPTLQAQKFDPEVAYTRQWVPEYDPGRAALNAKGALFKTAHAAGGLKPAGVRPRALRAVFEQFNDYPEPMVDHHAARDAALAALATIKKPSEE